MPSRSIQVAANEEPVFLTIKPDHTEEALDLRK